MDDVLHFSARVEAAMPASATHKAGMATLVAVSALVLAWGVVAQRPVTFATVILLVYAISSLRSMSLARTVMVTSAMAEFRGTQFVLRLPGVKLYQRRYINQTYFANATDIDGVGYLDGKMMIRSQFMTSVGTDDTQVVSNHNLRMCEVSLYVEAHDWQRLKVLFVTHGVRVLS